MSVAQRQQVVDDPLHVVHLRVYGAEHAFEVVPQGTERVDSSIDIPRRRGQQPDLTTQFQDLRVESAVPALLVGEQGAKTGSLGTDVGVILR